MRGAMTYLESHNGRQGPVYGLLIQQVSRYLRNLGDGKDIQC